MKQETRKLNFYSDPSHGWLAVKMADLETLGIADAISPYSYVGGHDFAFLEEDMDTGTFLNAAKRANWKIGITERRDDYGTTRELKGYKSHPYWQDNHRKLES